MQLNDYNMKLKNFDPNNSTENAILKYYDNNPGNAISARFDLSNNAIFKKNVGAIDSKITNLLMAKNM